MMYMSLSLSIYIYIYIFIFIYIDREREREREIHLSLSIYIYICQVLRGYAKGVQNACKVCEGSEMVLTRLLGLVILDNGACV